MDLIGPGDVIEVQGDHTYPGDLWFRWDQRGTADAPVTLRGIRVNGKRPILAGVGTERWHDMIILLNADHFVFEGFELVGDGITDHGGIVHKADNVTIRDVVVHGTASHGLMGTDEGSGTLHLLNSEFYNNGSGMGDHQIYMATDETAFPGSVFHMEGCYVHDGTGGNNVKSRAERNEIYYNWIENAVYHELDLIGPDGQDPALAREDSDVVGNVLIKSSEYRIARIGGDGTGSTNGRYRFVNNTMVIAAATEYVIGLQEGVEVLEMYNNVIIQPSAVGAKLHRHDDQSGPKTAFFGGKNFIQKGITSIPDGFTETLSGADAQFMNVAGFDFRPGTGSVLCDAGTATTSKGTPAFPNPLMLPASVPPARALGVSPRPSDGKVDIGAFEAGSISEPGRGGQGSSAGGGGSISEPGRGGQGSSNRGGGTIGEPGRGGQGNSAGGVGGGANTRSDAAKATEVTSSKDEGGCGCRIAGSTTSQTGAALVLLILLRFARHRPRKGLTS